MQGQTGEVSTSDEAIDGALRRLDAAVATLHAALLPNTLFMVFTGHVRAFRAVSDVAALCRTATVVTPQTWAVLSRAAWARHSCTGGT